jgi:hypothetical protein
MSPGWLTRRQPKRRHIAFVAPKVLRGPGKLLPSYFFPRFGEALAQEGYDISVSRGSVAPLDAEIIVAIYNEWHYLQDEALREAVRALERSARGKVFIHPGASAAFIGDKIAWNQGVASIVPVPRLCLADTAPEMIFSNLRVGTHQPVALVEPAAKLAPDRYNAQYIDTRHSYRGNDYHVSLRAMYVGTDQICLCPRARPVSDGDPSVHARDTPVDAGLLNALYEQVALPRQQVISAICRRLGERLGLGFYAHDLLPERDTGRTFVCESNIKFEDATHRAHYAPLRAELAFANSLYETDMTLAAKAFVSQLR